MAIKKYTVIVPDDQISRFEAVLDAGSIFVFLKYEKVKNGEYVLEAAETTIESLVKKFDGGLVGITNVSGQSSAVIKLDDGSIISINKLSNAKVMQFIEHLKKIYKPIWVLMYLVGYDEKCDDICVKYDI